PRRRLLLALGFGQLLVQAAEALALPIELDPGSALLGRGIDAEAHRGILQLDRLSERVVLIPAPVERPDQLFALKVLQPHLTDRSGDRVGGLRDRRAGAGRAFAEVAEALGRVVVRCGQRFRLALQDTRALQQPAAEADN